MNEYIHQKSDWPNFHWNAERLSQQLAAVRNKQGRIVGRMEALGFDLRSEAILSILTLDIIKSNEIEGEILNRDQVRSSIARHLGMDIAGLVPSDRHVDGVVEMMLDATQKFDKPLTDERLFGWHSSMFPAGRSGLYKITTGDWRTGPMCVVSGGMGREHIHFEAPAAAIVGQDMDKFIEWFNAEHNIDPVLKAAISHLWFVTIHPFDDGNGRIARAIADLQLARADNTAQRFYSMSAQIQKERSSYYRILEMTQKGSLDITNWLEWFLNCLDGALTATDETLAKVLIKAHFWDKHTKTKISDRQKLMLNKLLDGFDGKLTAVKWAKITKCSHDTALRDIKDLIEKDVLAKEEAGGRSSSYKLLD
jgi:Fic family protein